MRSRAVAGGQYVKGAHQRDLLSPNKSLVKIGKRCENSVQVECGPSYTSRGRPFGQGQRFLHADTLRYFGHSIVPAVLHAVRGWPPTELLKLELYAGPLPKD